MTTQEWGIVVGVIISITLLLAPWMAMVHAKLAVVASRIADLTMTVAATGRAHGDLLREHDRQIIRLEERVNDD